MRDVVVFRRWKSCGTLIALFPELPADPYGRYCDSYEHVGQHGGADYHGVIQATIPAKTEEHCRPCERIDTDWIQVAANSTGIVAAPRKAQGSCPSNLTPTNAAKGNETMLVQLRETVGNGQGFTAVTLTIEKDGLALCILPEGMNVYGVPADNPSGPILLERHNGTVRLLVWADINQEEPTHIIDLSDALESNRTADTN